MKRILMLLCIAALPATLLAQDEDNETVDSSKYKALRESYPKTNSLVHTKLDVRFDYDRSYLYGKEWLTLKPHFYPVDAVLLDAKGMEIKEVAMMTGLTKKQLKYKYDGMMLNIQLDRTYTAAEKYTLYFDYVSKPNEVKVQGSAAITDAKGLYFINPKGEDKNKPTQIWTQGETEANSVWMITIDKPNQKTTEEISMTVPAKYVTLSNGLLMSKKVNTDGTRTDYWKMDLPHAPYLFFMGVGDFVITKDTYKGKEVSYYTEKNQEQYARKVFGMTPEMIKFFSDKLGVDYPWQKYAQMVGRDFVSGAMENTTATLHQESAYQNNRQLTEGNSWEGTIAHELFHQWFGDLVTAESWTNITMNESFANYSEYLWYEYKYGKDKADEHHLEDMQGYLGSGSESKDLVRLHYMDKEDVFDAVSYNKGGRILHMLRNFVGDDAFFKSLNYYLTANKFKAGEAGQLRLAFEEVTGRDMTWFWNQWYYGNGHPKLKIDYNYDDAAGKAMVIVAQTQKSGKVFQLPIAVDVYTGADKVRSNVVLNKVIDTLYFNYTKRPDLINVDAEKILLSEKTDNKSEAEFIAQWKYAKNYFDRKEALEFFAKKSMPDLAKGLNDKYPGLKILTIQKLATSSYKTDAVVLEQVEALAKSDNKKVKAAAINFLVKNGNVKYLPLFQAAVNDSSYSVAGAALRGLAASDKAAGYAAAKKMSGDAKGALGAAMSDIIIANGTESDFTIVSKLYNDAPLSEAKIAITNKYVDYLVTVKDLSLVKKGIDDIMVFRNQIPSAYRSSVDPLFKGAFAKISKAKGAEIEEYVKTVFK
ncbi:MAG: M1 family metallopeptidase [Ferruginibacter sp.]